jgi:hypothetical protein
MRPNHIIIKMLADDYDRIYYSRGHHEKQDFMDALKNYLGDEFNSLHCTDANISHIYYKIVPNDLLLQYHEATKSTRGAFRATVYAPE